MGMSMPVYGSPNTDEETFALLDRALELGATNWDTSEYELSKVSGIPRVIYSY